MNKLSLSLLLACTVFCATCVTAQESHTTSTTETHTDSQASHHSGIPDHDAHIFKLDFVIEEHDGAHVVDRRAYRLDVDYQDPISSLLRSGDKVPVMTTEKGEQQYQYMDLGVSIDAKDAQLTGDVLAVNVSVRVERMPETTGSTPEKIIRNQQWSSRVLAALNKPTVIFSSDDPNSTHTFTVTLTPTQLR